VNRARPSPLSASSRKLSFPSLAFDSTIVLSDRRTIPLETSRGSSIPYRLFHPSAPSSAHSFHSAPRFRTFPYSIFVHTSSHLGWTARTVNRPSYSYLSLSNHSSECANSHSYAQPRHSSTGVRSLSKSSHSPPSPLWRTSSLRPGQQIISLSCMLQSFCRSNPLLSILHTTP